MRRKGKVDLNQGEIVDALRQMGCSVRSLSACGNGIPDLLVGYRGVNYLLEVKDGSLIPAHRKLTGQQETFHLLWQGSVSVVTNVTEALIAVGAK